MKIGIYTLPLNYNYGGLLQAYALQTVLQQMGHEVIVINRLLYHNEPFYARPREKMRRFYRKFFKKEKHIRVFEEAYQYSVYPMIAQHTSTFIATHINSVLVSNPKTLKATHFDAIVVGSDQIWRCAFHDTKQKLYNAFLAFTKGWNIKRIAYAASLGVNVWEYDSIKTKKCKALVKTFDAVSVREQSGVSLCKEHFSITAKHVLDPTLLLSKEHYLRLIKPEHKQHLESKIVVYILDKTPLKQRIVDKLSAELQLEVVYSNANPDNIYAPLDDRIQPPVEQWLDAFSTASYVVTDSFHACVFSLLFSKEFIAIGNEGRGMERFKSLLNDAGLEDRLFTNNTSFVLPQSNIEDGLKRLQEKKKESLIFLQNALK